MRCLMASMMSDATDVLDALYDVCVGLGAWQGLEPRARLHNSDGCEATDVSQCVT